MVELPRRGAFGGAQDPELFARARGMMRGTRGVSWVLAGHSRGAVVASQLASEKLDAMGGLAIIGSSHPRDVSLAALIVPVTKIAGTRDGLASPEEVRGNQHLLPAATRWVWVDGGNHSQFGWYGFQPGDRFADIDRDAQHALMIDAVLATMRTVADARAPAAPADSSRP